MRRFSIIAAVMLMLSAAAVARPTWFEAAATTRTANVSLALPVAAISGLACGYAWQQGIMVKVQCGYTGDGSWHNYLVCVAERVSWSSETTMTGCVSGGSNGSPWVTATETCTYNSYPEVWYYSGYIEVAGKILQGPRVKTYLHPC